MCIYFALLPHGNVGGYAGLRSPAARFDRARCRISSCGLTEFIPYVRVRCWARKLVIVTGHSGVYQLEYASRYQWGRALVVRAARLPSRDGSSAAESRFARVAITCIASDPGGPLPPLSRTQFPSRQCTGVSLLVTYIDPKCVLYHRQHAYSCTILQDSRAPVRLDGRICAEFHTVAHKHRGTCTHSDAKHGDLLSTHRPKCLLELDDACPDRLCASP